MTPEQLNARGKGCLPGHLGITVTHWGKGETRLELAVKPIHMAPNGFLHAGAIVTLADTACGYGCITNLPEGASGFTTVELKSNHLGTARDGTIECHAKVVHAGRTTQVWEIRISDDRGRLVCVSRCTLATVPREPKE